MQLWCHSMTIMKKLCIRFTRNPVIDERMKFPYKEWYQRMVEKHGAEAINTAEKSAKNYSSDKKQYKEYVN